MSLKTFHIAFITVSTALSVVMILWGGNEYRLSGSTTGLGVAVVGALCLAALIPYFRWVQKKFRSLSAVLAILSGAAALAFAPSAQACAVCFGDPNSVMTKGIRAGIILLVFVVGGVLGAIATVGITWARRAKSLQQ